jgi:hypothetical protein
MRKEMVKGIYLPVGPVAALEVREFNRLPDYLASVEGWIESAGWNCRSSHFKINF